MGIGTAISAGVGLVGGIMGKKSADKQAKAQEKAAKMGAKAADPFGRERGFYQGILRNIYGGFTGTGGSMASGVMPSERLPIQTGIDGLEQPGADTYIPAGAPAGTDVTGGRVGNVELAPTAYSPIEQFIYGSPEYKFRVKEGQRALERSAAAGGMLRSGNLLRDLVSFGQEQASTAYTSEINRIMTMAGANIGSPGVAGQALASGMAGAGATRAQGSAALQQGIGYGLTQGVQAFQNWRGQQASQTGMLQQQTGYGGGVSGILSGDEFASWNP